MEIVPIIKKNLSSIGENYDTLKPFMRTWLEKIETVIQDRKHIQAEASKHLKSVDFSVKSIAEDVGASRTTMYNHQQLLKRYIEYSAAEVASQSPLVDIVKLQEENSVLQDQIKKMMARDIDVELLKMQNRSLSTTLEGKNAEIKRLEARVEELSKENRSLKMSGLRPTSAGKSIAFKKQ